MPTDLRFGLDRRVILSDPLHLESGARLARVEVGYETYGTLDPDGGNAILICHALTGNQHVAGADPRTGRPGWWERMVGPGKPIDPARHFIVAANVLGGCSGSSGRQTLRSRAPRWTAARSPSSPRAPSARSPEASDHA